MSMPMRILVITLGLAAAGFVAGGAVGVVMMAAWIIYDTMPVFAWRGALLFGGMFGGMVGAVLGPVAAWLLMRHVALWLAIGGTALGTLTGAVLGLLLGGWGESFNAALLGFGAAAMLLRLRKPRRRAIAPRDMPGIARASQGV